MTTAEMVHRSSALFREHAINPEEMAVCLERMGLSDPQELIKVQASQFPHPQTLWFNGIFMGYVLAGGKL